MLNARETRQEFLCSERNEIPNMLFQTSVYVTRVYGDVSKVKGPLHAMKLYRVNGGIFPLILNFNTGLGEW